MLHGKSHNGKNEVGEESARSGESEAISRFTETHTLHVKCPTQTRSGFELSQSGSCSRPRPELFGEKSCAVGGVPPRFHEGTWKTPTT